MGLFSSSSKSSNSQTQNTTNTSVSTAFNQSGGGTAVWGNGNAITTTDHDAMNTAATMFESGASMASDLASTFTSFGSRAFDVADNANMQMGAVADRAIGASEFFVDRAGKMAETSIIAQNDLTKNALASNERLASDSILAQNALSNEAMGLSRDVVGMAGDFGAMNAQLAKDSMAYGGDLAREFMAGSQQTNKDAQQTVLDTTKYALQFADNQTRSDGQQYAVEASKNNMYTMIAVAGVIAVVVFMGRK